MALHRYIDRPDALSAIGQANKKVYHAPESSFGGVRVADRVRETVPDRRTSNGKSPGPYVPSR